MMINRKDTPAPFVHRAEPPSLRQWSTTQQSTPQTPQPKSRPRRTSRLNRQNREANNEHARGPAEDNVRNERISHDLSLTENMRHSIVDNMLMSLNPDQPSIFSTSKPLSAGSDLSQPPRTAQSRHLHSSSTTSDSISAFSDGSPDRRSYHIGSSRRSNSSSNFQSVLGRIDSVHHQSEAADRKRAELFQAQRPGGRELLAKGHARKDSKDGGPGMMEYGQVSSQYKIPQQTVLGRRSASFDHGYSRRGFHSASNSGTDATIPNSLSQPFTYDEIDAAPNPTVPAGPRRDNSPAFPPHHTQLPPVRSADQRRNSTKSSKSLPARKTKGDTVRNQPPMPTNSSFVGSKRFSKQIPPVPALKKSRDTSPVRQFSEPLVARKQDPMFPPKDAAKERPSFFRRVFGSSKGSPAVELQTSQTPPPRMRKESEPNNRSGPAASNRLGKPPTTDDLAHPPRPEAGQPTVVKKPSSFFRRRKKSVSENLPSPPSLQPHIKASIAAVEDDTEQHSPASSLRKVMNPYLDAPNTSPLMLDATQFHGLDEIASAPQETDTVRHRLPMDHTANFQGHGVTPHGKLLTHQTRDPPLLATERSGVKSHLNPDDILHKPNDNSFLYDDSSAGDRTPDPHETVRRKRDAKSGDPATPGSFADVTPRASSKVPIYKSNLNSTDSPNYPKVLSSRDTDVLGTDSIHGRKSEPREWLGASQSTPTRKQPSPTDLLSLEDRVWLQHTNSEEIRNSAMSLTIEGTDVSPVSEYVSARSTLHPLKTDDVHFPEPAPRDSNQRLSVDLDTDRPNDSDRTQAKQIFDNNETIVSKSAAAAWLGEPGPDRARVRRAYMELFNWQNLNILAALRDLCGRLYLKGESQQVDRILDAFSTRWCDCNPNHGFKAIDVVHTICYSILLLNTDLHQAEIETKMTRTQFLKNILPTIRRVVTDAAPDAFPNPRASTMPLQRTWADSSSTRAKSPTFAEAPEARRSFEGARPAYRLSQRPSDQTVYSLQMPTTPTEVMTTGDCGPLVRAPFHGKLTSWENQVEYVLKEFFNSIRQQPLPLHGTESKRLSPDPTHSSHSLSVTASNVLRRTPSMLSKAGSENMSYSRGRASDNRLGTGRWQSKTRSRGRLYPASTVTSSRRSSFDEQSSVATPSTTSAWSKFSFGRTQTTLSTDSLASGFPQIDYQQSIGFANALSQAIIREEGATGDEESLKAAPLLEDESLELAGAPWAKEGILKHKHHLETMDKKAKERNWVESFAVIEKGYMRLFSFSMNAKSLRQKAKSQKAPGNVVGGGNWADNAELLGCFVLRQTIASALPPPGYSKARPHVWALSLPTGAVHLFQVGTPEIVKEFVTTANYWSARLSKEPLVGGVSNIEYGWSSNVINAALVYADSNISSTGTGARPSLQSSIRSGRSSMDQGSYRPKLPGDKIAINDWMPPQQSMVPSALMEVDQLKALLNYVKNIEEDLQRHNELRGAVLLAFSPRHANSAKAMTNWERKSSYLLHEIVKFRTYIDCLRAAQDFKEKLYAERGQTAPAPLETLSTTGNEKPGAGA